MKSDVRTTAYVFDIRLKRKLCQSGCLLVQEMGLTLDLALWVRVQNIRVADPRTTQIRG